LGIPIFLILKDKSMKKNNIKKYIVDINIRQIGVEVEAPSKDEAVNIAKSKVLDLIVPSKRNDICYIRFPTVIDIDEVIYKSPFEYKLVKCP
jgi:hypothetical protein